MNPVVQLYRALLWLASPAAVLITVAHGIRHRSLRYVLQRLGLRLPRLPAPPVWMHCASVGELRLALSLARAWRAKHPQQVILITSTTASSGRLFERQHHGGKIVHCYLPLDYPLLCRRFLDRIQARCSLMMETEIWLNFYRECHERGIPPTIVNARLSQRTLRTLRWGGCFSAYFQQSLRMTRAILARSEQDRRAYLALGAGGTVEVIGNLKYAADTAPASPADLIGRPYCLAASTHDDEEWRIAQAWRRASHGGLLLVIAPRHSVRATRIARRLCKAGFKVARHGDSIAGAEICLYDRIGDMDALMRHARLVFLGGSLVQKGGHNLLEAARLGTPQATGPHLFNVSEEAQALERNNALLIIKNEQELPEIFSAAAANKNAYAELAANAAAYLQSQADIAARYLDRIEALYPAITTSKHAGP